MLDGSSNLLAEMLANAEVNDFRLSRFFNLERRRIDIFKMELTDQDLTILKLFVNKFSPAINLAFLIMAYHFPDSLNRENLYVFKTCGNKEIKTAVFKIEIKISAAPRRKDLHEFIKNLSQEIVLSPV